MTDRPIIQSRSHFMIGFSIYELNTCAVMESLVMS